MRNFLAFVGLVVVAFVGVGWYLGWYKLAFTPGKDGKQNISVEVDVKKAETDIGKKVEQGGHLIKDNLKKEDATPPEEFVGPPEPKAKVNSPAPR